jgi:hypothetical protein
LGAPAKRGMQALMRKALMSAPDEAWYYRPKRGKYRRRTNVRIGKPRKGKRLKVDS